MARRDLTGALALLLADERLRTMLRDDPAALVRRLDVRPSDRTAVAALDADQLDAQAATLVGKRLHEVARLAPRTFARLGAEAATLFRAEVVPHWPSGHRRHLLDAARFCEAAGPRACPAERNRLRFLAARRRMAAHALAEDRPAVQVLVRWRDVIRELGLDVASLGRRRRPATVARCAHSARG